MAATTAQVSKVSILDQLSSLPSKTVSFPGCAESIEASDLVLDIGPLHSDSNTGGFTRNISDSHLVLLGHSHCQVQAKKFDGVHFLPVLKRIVEELEKDSAKYQLPRTLSRKQVEVRNLLVFRH